MRSTASNCRGVDLLRVNPAHRLTGRCHDPQIHLTLGTRRLWQKGTGSEPNDPHPAGQATAGRVEAEALAVLAEEFEGRTALAINEENALTVAAALNNVLRLTRNDDSGHARHADNRPLTRRKANN